MKWYEIKEQAAGTKRLFLLWYIYKILGKTTVKIITFFVTLIACINAKQVRECSKKYLEIVGEKPSFKNVFRHFLSYSYSLVDRMEIFTNNFHPEKLYFEDEEQKKLFLEDLKNFKGTFFICNHLGNVDAMRSFVNSDIKDTCSSVSVFLAKEQCKIFSGFIEKITTNKNINLYPVEEIDINTSIEIKEKLNKGGIVFMAGDRISAQSNNLETEFLNHKVLFPVGTFKSYGNVDRSNLNTKCNYIDGNYKGKVNAIGDLIPVEFNINMVSLKGNVTPGPAPFIRPQDTYENINIAQPRII